MRSFLQKEFRNIVFIVLVVAAALAIYFLSRAVKSAGTAAATPEPAQTSASLEDESSGASEAVFSGVPEEVLLAHLLTADTFRAEPATDGDRAWILTVGESPSVSARFVYTVEQGAVTGFTLALPLPVASSAKSKSGVDQYLAAAEGELQAAWSRAVVALLTDLVPACDADDAIGESTVRLWAQKVSAFDKAGDAYADEAGGVSFDAYITKEGDGLSLVCSLAATQ